jgi:hypothetical protein
MAKRRLLRWSLLLAIFAAFAVWLEPACVFFFSSSRIFRARARTSADFDVCHTLALASDQCNNGRRVWPRFTRFRVGPVALAHERFLSEL